MKAILLAAGRGSRLQSLTRDKPKCLVPLNGRPLLDYAIDTLQRSGCDQVAIVTGYQADKIQHPGLCQRFHNPNWASTNMVASLCQAQAWLRQDECVISYSDIFYTPESVRILRCVDAPISLTYDPHFAALWSDRFEHPLDDLESFQLNEKGLLTDIGQPVSALSEIQGQFMGLLKITPEGWMQIQSALAKDFPKTLDMTSLLYRLIGLGIPIQAVPIEGPWGEVDTPSDVRLYESDPKRFKLVVPSLV